MKPRKTIRKPCLEENVGWLSWLLFAWLNPIFKKGWKGDLKDEDLNDTAWCDRAAALSREVTRRWKCELHASSEDGRKPSLSRVIMAQFGKRFGIAGVVVFAMDMVRAIALPLITGELISFFSRGHPAEETPYAYLCATLFTACAVLEAFTNVPAFLWTRLAMQARIATSCLIYQKALRLNRYAYSKTDSGHVINLLSTDVTRFDAAVWYLHSIWTAPLSLIIIFALLWSYVGMVALIGVIFLITVSCPLQVLSAKLSSSLAEQISTISDKRVKFMSELIAGIQVIKFYAWEKPFTEMMMRIRKVESVAVKRYSLTYLTLSALVYCTEKSLSFITIVTIMLMGDDLTPLKTFLVTILTSFLSWMVGWSFTGAIQHVSELRVSLRRMEEFLLLEESRCDDVNGANKSGIDLCGILGEVMFQNVSVYLEDPDINNHRTTNSTAESVNKSFILRDITFQVDRGKLACIVGHFGSGKSSILSAALGELTPHTGIVRVGGKIAYVPQQPWIFPGTLRENILFGKKFDRDLYEKVLQACALKRDLETLPSGDLTRLADRGRNLSGGQRARIGLARAAYRDAQIYLLDDPLSAVDTVVGNHIMEECICGFLGNKTRILVTHQLQYLKSADHIIVLEDGRIVQSGKNDIVLKMKLDNTFLSKYENTHVDLKGGISKKENMGVFNELNIDNNSDIDEVDKSQSYWPICKEFLYVSGLKLTLLYIILNLLGQAALIFSDLTLAHWVDVFASDTNGEQSEITVNASSKSRELYPMTVLYIATVLTYLIIMVVRCVAFGNLVNTGANNIYNSMFTSVLGTQLRFFSSGRILNRFSNDVRAMDQDLVINASEFIENFVYVASVALMSVYINPFVVMPTMPLLVAVYFTGKFYIRTIRACEKLQSANRDPIYSLVTVSLQGLHSIRAFNMVHALEDYFHQCYDNYTTVSFVSMSAPRWLALHVNSLVSLALGAVVTACIFMADSVSPGQVALVTSFYVATGVVSYLVQLGSYVQENVNSVDRALQYTKLKPEKGPEKMLRKVPDDWPRYGVIEFLGVGLSYAEDDGRSECEVLHDVQFTAKAGEKIGIVGRTGAGKSSLVNALCRMTENITGLIRIDGIDTANVCLRDLRSRVAVIPQEPVLFSGSLRYNLDPFFQYSSSSIWNALEKVQLKTLVENMPNQLETEFSECGAANMSAGQKQLICLARALLKRNRILVVDEATASVDQKTDEVIQRTIREEFADCTVLTIAHRLNTVMDSDRILVMDGGAVKEFDSPQKLMYYENGIFKRMAAEAKTSK